MFAATSNNALAGSSTKLDASYAASNAGSYHNVQNLQQLKAGGKNSPESIAEIGRQFESLLAHQMLKAMRSATQVWSEDSMFSSERVAFYQQMMDDQLSLELTRGQGLGLAKQFANEIGTQYQQLAPKADSETESKNLVGQLGFDLNVGGLLRRTEKLPMSLEYKTQLNSAQKNSEQLAGQKLEQTLVSTPSALTTSPAEQGKKQPQFFASPEAFIETMREPANTAAKMLGVATEVLLAQAALESGWGNKTIRNDAGKSSFNLFGIKADSRWQGEVAEVKTLEYFAGAPVNVNAKFRSYNSYAESFSDYVNFIQSNNRYQNVSANPQQYPQALQQAGYATDPHYADKIESIMQRLGQSSDAAQLKFTQTEFKG